MPSLLTSTVRAKASPKAQPAKDSGTRWYDAVRQDATLEAGFAVTTDLGHCTYSWMQFNGTFQPLGKRQCVIRMGKEDILIDYPEGFPTDQFVEAIRTQRLQRIEQKPTQGLKITLVEADDEEETP